MDGFDGIKEVAFLLSYLMVIMALAISASTTLKQMVKLYQAQAWVLTIVVLVTSLEPGGVRMAVASLALLPAALAALVPPLLRRASLTQLRPASAPGRGRSGPRAWVAAWRGGLRDLSGHADLTWLQHGKSRLRGGMSAAIEMLLIAVAVLVAYRLIRGVGGIEVGAVEDSEARDLGRNLAVSIALVLQGLFTMANKRDIIAQVVGLLVIEHGLFVAAVRVAPSDLAFLFVLSLFFYVLVTLTILLWILPELHRASMSIEVTDHSRLKG
jgi:hydrogenase-4 membrane subunit HyfE